MSHHIHFWSDLTTNDFGRLDTARAIAVMPLAATEQHGPHLPLSTDTVIAEGIETLGERDFVADCGIRLMQGYLFAKPLELAALLSFITASGQ